MLETCVGYLCRYVEEVKASNIMVATYIHIYTHIHIYLCRYEEEVKASNVMAARERVYQQQRQKAEEEEVARKTLAQEVRISSVEEFKVPAVCLPTAAAGDASYRVRIRVRFNVRV